MNINIILVLIIPEAGIDGDALNELVGDFEEFSTLITARLERLRIKKFVRTMKTVSEDRETNCNEV